MSNNLTSAQCDAFMEDHDVEVRRACYGVRDKYPWCCSKIGKGCPNTIGKTRQQAITAYWQKHHKDWTPPVEDEWTTEKALEYVVEHDLSICRDNASDPTNRWIIANGRMVVQNYGCYNKLVGITFTTAVHNWKLKHDPDKPELTREETAMGLLRDLRVRVIGRGIEAEFFDRVEAFLKEADHDK